MKQEDQHKLLPIIKALKENPQLFLANEELSKQISLQARLYMQPRLMHDSQAVIIKTHKIKENPPLLQHELALLVQRIAEEVLQKKQGLQVNYEGSIQGEAKLTPLQRKYAYVIQGLTKQQIGYEEHFSVEVLYQHILSGNVAAFGQALKSLPKDFDLNQEPMGFLGTKRASLLRFALNNKRPAMANVLLESKHCTENVLRHTNIHGETLLISAVRHGYADVVQKILDHPYCTPEFVQQVYDYNSSLMWAAELGNTNIIKILLSKYNTPVFFSQTTKFGDTILMTAIREGLVETVRALLANNHCTSEFVMHTDRNGESALLLAAGKDGVEMVRMLLEKSRLSKPTFTSQLLMQANDNGTTALIRAIECWNTDVVQLLLENEYCTAELLMKTEHKRFWSENALTMATRSTHGSTDIIKLLLAHQYVPQSF